jgi:tRNA-specific 2-thiouridylase
LRDCRYAHCVYIVTKSLHQTPLIRYHEHVAKVILGMSGGVDSSVSAHVLREADHEVVGLSLLMFETRIDAPPTACCSLYAIEDAARTAAILGIPHRTLDVREAFMKQVVEPFVKAYLKGLTPNPCILCNRHIKFPLLLDEARRGGAEFIATGHYALAERSEGETLLKKGIDPGKDQSYVLYALSSEELQALLLPLGTYTKDQVREIAQGLGLPACNRPESQEICFVPGNDYGAFIAALYPEAARPGPIFGPDGQGIGTHQGLYRYTIGQRRALGISSPTPLYVTKIDRERNALHVGPREETYQWEFTVGDINWLVPQKKGFRADVKVRSMMDAQPAAVDMTSKEEVRICFDEPQFAITPGQAAVFYIGDTVVGGGTITKV